MEDKTILIVDDEIDFGFLMKEFFLQKGCKVFLATTIAAGLGLLQQEKPDVLLMDNQLPDGFGWSKTDFILQNYPNIHLILISAFEVPKTSSSLFSIMQKPFLKDELLKMFS